MEKDIIDSPRGRLCLCCLPCCVFRSFRYAGSQGALPGYAHTRVYPQGPHCCRYLCVCPQSPLCCLFP